MTGNKLLFTVLLLSILSCSAAFSGGVDIGPSKPEIMIYGGSFRLNINNIDVDGTPLSVSWSLDPSTANWTLTGASNEVSPDLKFTVDSGIRVKNASNPNAVVDRETGTVYLYYERRSDSGPGTYMVASSDDGLAFSNEQESGSLHARLDPRAVLLPTGIWRKYYPREVNKGPVVSESSSDGYEFQRDDGVRYMLHDSDNESFGVYNIYRDHTGGIVLLYIGDMKGRDNVRMAYSIDGGNSFEFVTNNVLGDLELDKSMKFVDPKTLLLPDGRRRLVTMRRGENGVAPLPGKKAIGEIHTFISPDGRHYYHEPGIRIKYSDFTEYDVWSLNDPVMVRLNDGRYRIYVAALITEGPNPSNDSSWWAIVSATSEPEE